MIMIMILIMLAFTLIFPTRPSPFPCSAMSSMRLVNSMIIDRRLQHMALREVRIAGDGNCQFSAVHASMRALGKQCPDPSELRSMAVDHLVQGMYYYHDYWNDSREASFSDYLWFMADDRYWADHLTLYALAKVLDIRIHVLEKAADESHDPWCNDTDTDVEIVVLFTPGNHYDATQPRGHSCCGGSSNPAHALVVGRSGYESAFPALSKEKLPSKKAKRNQAGDLDQAVVAVPTTQVKRKRSQGYNQRDQPQCSNALARKKVCDTSGT